MDERIVELLEPMQKHMGASEQALQRLAQYAGGDLPADYLEFLRWSNGAEGAMRPYLALIADKLTYAPTHHIFSAEKVLEYAASAEDHAQDWRARWPGYVVISYLGSAAGLLNAGNRHRDSLPFAVGHCFGEVGEDLIIYRARSVADLISYLSTASIELTNVDLQSADLRGSHLFNAHLTRATLARADLADADLRLANLEQTDLTGANLAGANLWGAFYNAQTLWPQGFDPREHEMEFVPFVY